MLSTTRRVVMTGLLLVAACASTEVTSRQPYEGEKLARPGSDHRGRFRGEPVGCAGRLCTCRSDGGAEHAANDGRGAARAAVGRAGRCGPGRRPEEMGLPAVRAAGQAPPVVDDIVCAATSSASTRVMRATGRRRLWCRGRRAEDGGRGLPDDAAACAGWAAARWRRAAVRSPACWCRSRSSRAPGTRSA